MWAAPRHSQGPCTRLHRHTVEYTLDGGQKSTRSNFNIPVGEKFHLSVIMKKNGHMESYVLYRLMRSDYCTTP